MRMEGEIMSQRQLSPLNKTKFLLNWSEHYYITTALQQFSSFGAGTSWPPSTSIKQNIVTNMDILIYKSIWMMS